MRMFLFSEKMFTLVALEKKRDIKVRYTRKRVWCTSGVVEMFKMFYNIIHTVIIIQYNICTTHVFSPPPPPKASRRDLVDLKWRRYCSRTRTLFGTKFRSRVIYCGRERCCVLQRLRTCLICFHTVSELSKCTAIGRFRRRRRVLGNQTLGPRPIAVGDLSSASVSSRRSCCYDNIRLASRRYRHTPPRDRSRSRKSNPGGHKHSFRNTLLVPSEPLWFAFVLISMQHVL